MDEQIDGKRLLKNKMHPKIYSRQKPPSMNKRLSWIKFHMHMTKCVRSRAEISGIKNNQGWAIIPEVDPSHENVELRDMQIPDPAGNTPDEVERLHQII